MIVATNDQAQALALAALYADGAKLYVRTVRSPIGTDGARSRWITQAKLAGYASDYWSLESIRPGLGKEVWEGDR